ncbi:MAG: precorrin-8X methylmutase [Thiotrichales bacterium]|nr:precorrin-8X methylmutase [Thiotrichales bacterium]
MKSYEYIRDPGEIYQLSSQRVRELTDVSSLPPQLHDIAYRLVHACGMPDIVAELAWEGDPATVARHALSNGGSILVDAMMVANGVIRDRLPAANNIVCTLNDAGTEDIRREQDTTRSAAAIELWRQHLDGAVVAIGNAPTALFRLLEILQRDSDLRPAAIFGFPVGFVGAVESKAALAESMLGVPFLTLHGRRGGSALAAAAINALAGPMSQ